MGGVIVCPSLALRCHSLNVWVESIKPTPILDILDFDDCDLRTDTVSALMSLTGIRGALAPGLTVSFDIFPIAQPVARTPRTTRTLTSLNLVKTLDKS